MGAESREGKQHYVVCYSVGEEIGGVYLEER